MNQPYIRICPVCGAHNPLENASCSCGASLASVDFTLASSPSEPPETIATRDIAVVIETPPAGVTVCPHADCAQPNPPGLERCLYCNRPLHEQAASQPKQTAGMRHALPEALRADYRVLEEFPATGSEADLMLVESLSGGERLVAKLYRKGIAPNSELLARLSQNPTSHVVKLYKHGQSDGYAYELMEYCAHGTLRRLLDSGPLAGEMLRQLVMELAAAMGEIHAQRILHRDLKPENILLRSIDPLHLALTDFGISSLQQATQHFTTMAGTVKYAAPEAMTGVIDEKADWWSMGMILLEAATGRHPFADLSDPVISHHLATRPLDVRQIYDEPLRTLCRGLLLRDPKRRWSAGEVTRWLAGDAALHAPEDSEGPMLAVRPYHLGSAKCTTAAELATALALNWEDGSKDIRRGDIGDWLVQQLNDHNLARRLQDILDLRGVSDDYRLLRFLLAAAPGMPGVWRSKPLAPEAILAEARQAFGGDKEAQAWLDSIAAESVLEACREAGATEYQAIEQRWRDAWERFSALWEIAHHAEAAWRAVPKPIDGSMSSAYVNMDDVMYSRPLRLALPSRRSLNAKLLLALHDPSYVEMMHVEVLSSLAEISEYCPWFASIGDIAQLDPIGVLAAHQLLPLARNDVADEKKRLGGYHDNREQNIATIRDKLEANLRQILDTGKEPLNAQSVRLELHEGLTRFQETSRWATSLAYSEESYRKLLDFIARQLDRADDLISALNQLDTVEEYNAIFFQPYRLFLGAVILMTLFFLAAPWLALISGTGFAVFAALRVKAWKQAGKAVDDAFRAFARQTRALPRDTRTEGG